MSFSYFNSSEFIGSIPDSVLSSKKSSICIIYGGINYATKEWIKDQVTSSAKEKTIFVYANMSSPLKNSIQFAKTLASQKGIEISDLKILCFSGGAEGVIPSINIETFSFIGLIDSTPPSNTNILNGLASKVRMIYSAANWKKQEELSKRFKPFEQAINKNGGKAEEIAEEHSKMVSLFFSKYEKDITTQINLPPTSIKPDTSVKINAGQTNQGQPTSAQAAAGSTNNATQEFPVADINPKEIESFEKVVHEDLEDTQIPIMDDLTTVEGFLRSKIDKEYVEKSSEGQKEFYGIILRIPEVFQGPHYDYSVEKAITTLETNARQSFYKVRVVEEDAKLEMPLTFDMNEKDRFRIDMHRDFTGLEDVVLRLGDKVVVTFDNLKHKRGGRILRRVPQSLQDKIVIGSMGEQASTNTGGGTIGDAWNGSAVPPVPADLGGTVELELCFPNKPRVPTLAKLVQKTPKPEYLTVAAADRYIQMKKQYDAENKSPLYLVDGTRTRAEQEALFNLYKSRGYHLANSPDYCPPGGHRAGDAVDLPTGGWTTPTYIWLFKNSPKYDWFNNGRFFSEKEHWHNQHAPGGRGTNPKAAEYHRAGIPYNGISSP